MAVWTRVGWPTSSRASCKARALITVASIPILSAVARSIPREAPFSPRKMLPPPTTMAICTLRASTASATSSARRFTTTASMPEPMEESANASPESFSSTRPHRLSATAALLLADFDPHEAGDLRLGPEPRQQRPDGDLRVAHEALLDEDVVLVEPADAALDDLRDGLLRLALVAGEGLEDGPLRLDHVGGDLVAGHPPGGGRGDVEGDVVPDLHRLRVGRVDAGDLHEDADRAPVVLEVLVALDQAAADLEAGDPAEADVLAQRARQALDVLVDGLGRVAGERLAGDVLTLLGRLAGEGGDRALEAVALGHEVGLAGQFGERADAAVDEHVDRSLLGGPAGPLASGGQTLLPEPGLGLVEVALRLLQGAFAVHHAGAGQLPAPGDVLRRDVRHGGFSESSQASGATSAPTGASVDSAVGASATGSSAGAAAAASAAACLAAARRSSRRRWAAAASARARAWRSARWRSASGSGGGGGAAACGFGSTRPLRDAMYRPSSTASAITRHMRALARMASSLPGIT